MKLKIIIISAISIVAFFTTFTYHLTQRADMSYYQGHRLFLKGKYAKAESHYTKAIEEGSTRRETYEELAYCYLWTGNSERSIQLFQDIVVWDPDDLEIKISLARAYSWNRRYREAIGILKGIVLTTDSDRAKKTLAEVYLWNGQPKESKIILEPLVKRYPDDQGLKLLWGKALYYTGDPEKASRVFEEVLKEGNE